MNNLDQKLQQSGNIRPRRPLPSNFTANTIQYIKNNPRPVHWAVRIKETIYMKILAKPLALAAVILVALLAGGSTYSLAVNDWSPTSAVSSITAIFKKQEILVNGNRIVEVDANNCGYFAPKAVYMPPKSNSPEDIANSGKQLFEKYVGENPTEKLYYEVKKDSKYTNDQIVQMVQGICEDNSQNRLTHDIIMEISGGDIQKLNHIEGGTGYTIEVINPDSIILALDESYGQGYKVYTFQNIAPDVKVYDNHEPVTYQDLKVGDHVAAVLKYEVTTLNLEVSDPMRENTDLATIAALIKTPAPDGDAMKFYSGVGVDFVRTEPCDTDPSGFCRSYDFMEDRNYERTQKK